MRNRQKKYLAVALFVCAGAVEGTQKSGEPRYREAREVRQARADIPVLSLVCRYYGLAREIKNLKNNKSLPECCRLEEWKVRFLVREKEEQQNDILRHLERRHLSPKSYEDVPFEELLGMLKKCREVGKGR